MEMTIDEDILVELFKESKMPIDKAIETIVYIASRRRNILNRLEREACANAIKTMRKYKKIEEIVKEWRESGLLQDKFYDLINEVLEDGKID